MKLHPTRTQHEVELQAAQRETFELTEKSQADMEAIKVKTRAVLSRVKEESTQRAEEWQAEMASLSEAAMAEKDAYELEVQSMSSKMATMEARFQEAGDRCDAHFVQLSSLVLSVMKRVCVFGTLASSVLGFFSFTSGPVCTH